MLTVQDLEESESLHTIVVPLIVPTDKEVENIKDLDLSNSALNACYSKPIKNRWGELNSWYEVEIKVEGEQDLPPKDKWFYIITDDGHGFEARFVGKKTKKISTFEDKEIIGRWIKERLANLGLVPNFEFAFQDFWKNGVITKETLKDYGGDKLILKKTTRFMRDEKRKRRDIWLLSFPSEKYSSEELEQLDARVYLLPPELN